MDIIHIGNKQKEERHSSDWIGHKKRHILIRNISSNIESVVLVLIIIIGSNIELFRDNSVSIFIITGEVK